MPGVTTITTAFPAAGTITITDTTAVAVDLLTAAVTAQTTFLATTLTPAPDGKGIPGSIAQSLNLSYQTLINVSTHLGQINSNLETLITAVGKTNTELSQANKHAGVSNSHANKANVVAELAFIDQNDKNNFDKKVVNATLEKAGEPPIQNNPVDLQADVQKKVSDITSLNAAIAATGVIIEGAQTAIAEGFKLAGEILLDTAVGKKLVEFYYESEIAVVSVFSKERAQRLIIENKSRGNMAKTGSVPVPPVAPG